MASAPPRVPLAALCGKSASRHPRLCPPMRNSAIPHGGGQCCRTARHCEAMPSIPAVRCLANHPSAGQCCRTSQSLSGGPETSRLQGQSYNAGAAAARCLRPHRETSSGTHVAARFCRRKAPMLSIGTAMLFGGFVALWLSWRRGTNRRRHSRWSWSFDDRLSGAFEDAIDPALRH